MKNQIAHWGWFNGNLIHDLADQIDNNPDKSISEFYQEFRQRTLSGQDFPLKNQGLVVSLLYSTLVIPRELWEDSRTSGTMFSFTTENLFTLEVGAYTDNWDFLRLMRNSVSHANFDMSLDGEYTFWNNDRNGTKNFEISIMHSDIFHFINELGSYYLINVAQQVAASDR